MSSQPLLVDHDRIVAALGLGQHIAGVSVTPEPAVERSAADPEHFRRSVVRLREPGPIGLKRSAPEIQRDISHSKVGSRSVDRVKGKAV
jgi:hypothetical protein